MLVRYADDFVVMCPTESKAKEALRQIELVMSRLGLKLHPEKTRMVDLRRGKGELSCFWGARFARSGVSCGTRAGILHAAVAVAQGDEATPGPRA